MKNRKILMLIGVSMLLLGMQACTSIKMTYNWADYLIYWRLDSHFDISSSQKEILEKKLDNLHTWHRQVELPKYIVFLDEIKIRLQNGIDKDDMAWYGRELKQFNINLANFIAQDTAEFLTSLSSEQIAYLENKLNENNEERMEKIEQTKEEAKAEAIEKGIESATEWWGDLSEDQKKVIEAGIVIDKKSQMVAYNHRKKSQQKFINLLKEKIPIADLREQLLDWYLNPGQFYTQEYRSIAVKRRNRNNDNLVKIDSLATQKQRAHLIDKIDSYKKQLQELINEKT
ncbi:MAG: hypothetical protein HN945_16160 [Deltaproteobacteria bacterium]|nr:hypothetical protein [Deltaproteobacteria bacterium]MBT7153971.1 hypothetical protein [Deltaproteobacteria bacterium]